MSAGRLQVYESDAVRVTFDPRQSVAVDRPFTSLPAGGQQTFGAQTPPGRNCFDPDCMVCAVVDSEEAVSESNETNNKLCKEKKG